MADEQRGSGRRSWSARDAGLLADAVVRLAAVGDDLCRLTEELTTLAVEVTGADRATVLVADGHRLVPTLALGVPIDPGDDRTASLLDGGLLTTVEIDGSGSLVLVPVASAGRTFAVVALEWSDGGFERDDLRMLEALAMHAGDVVERVRHDAAERQAAAGLVDARCLEDVALVLLEHLRARLGADGVPAVAVLDLDAGVVARAAGADAPWSGTIPGPLADLAGDVFAGDVVDAPGVLADLVEADLRDVAGQLLGAVALLARHHAELLPDGSTEALTAQRLAEMATAGRWGLEEEVRRAREGDR